MSAESSEPFHIMDQRPTISRTVFEQLEDIRQSGRTNMFDRPTVLRLAQIEGYTELAQWLRTHKTEYSVGILCGFEVVDA